MIAATPVERLRYRMQFAEVYPTKAEVGKVLPTFGTWWNVIKALPKALIEANGMTRDPDRGGVENFRCVNARFHLARFGEKERRCESV